MEARQPSRVQSPQIQPKPKEWRPVRNWVVRHPYAAIAAVPLAGLYGATYPAVNRFTYDFFKYTGRLGKNVYNAISSTPFRVTQLNTTNSTNPKPIKPTPNPTPFVSSGSKEYDEQHPRTIRGKNY